MRIDREENSESILGYDQAHLQDLQKIASEYASELSPARCRELSHLFTKEATENRTDMYALVYSISRLINQEDKAEGVSGLVTINKYIDDNKFTFKTLTPTTSNDEQYYKKHLEKTLKEARQKLPRYASRHSVSPEEVKKTSSLIDQVTAYRDLGERVAKGKRLDNPLPLSFDQILLTDWRKSGVSPLYAVLTTLMTELPGVEEFFSSGNPELLKEALYKQTVGTLDALRSGSKALQSLPQCRKFDPYQMRHGGVSLQDIYLSRADSSSPDRVEHQTILLHKYLSFLPRGDVFWNKMEEILFFNIPLIAAETDLSQIEEFPWFKKLITWQQQIGDQLVGVPLAQYYNFELPQRFIPQDLSYLCRPREASSEMKLRKIISFGTFRGITLRSFVTPEVSFQQLTKQSLLYQTAQNNVGLMDEDEMIINAIWGVKDRFEIDNPILASRLSLQSAIDRLTPVMSSAFEQWVHEEFGDVFLRKLQQVEPQMDHVTGKILSGDHTLAASRWGEDIVNVEVTLDEDSLVRKLGIRSSFWEFPSDQTSAINFVLLTSNIDLSISGFVNLVEQRIELRYLRLDDNLSHMETTMKLVASSILHDILGRRISRWKRSSAEEEAPCLKSKHSHKRSEMLPRKWFRVNSQDLISEFQIGKINNSLDKVSETTRQSSYVSAHVRRVPYGAVIEALIEKYNDPDVSSEYRTSYLKSIRELRDGTDPQGRKLATPDREKLENLPPAFYREVQPIKDPDGRLLNTRTFIAPFFNPRLSIEDYENVLTLYKASYRSHGSSLAFLELALANLAGLENEVSAPASEI